MRRAAIALVLAAGLIGCSRKSEGPSPSPDAAVTAEPATRCRELARAAIPGDDVIVGEATVSADEVVLGVVRRAEGKQVATLVRAPLDLAVVRAFDVGPTVGDAPPPLPRRQGRDVLVATYLRQPRHEGAPAERLLRLAPLMGGAALGHHWDVPQQSDDSFAFDIAFPEGAQHMPLVVWDEDAPILPGAMLASRGLVKAQHGGGEGRARVVSPDASDAESPRVVRRASGYWVAWIARRAEQDDAGAESTIESPAERRAFRWVEAVPVDFDGAPSGPVRKLTSPTGRVAWFDLAPSASEGLVAIVQDEAAAGLTGGGRLFRVVLEGGQASSSALVDGGVGVELAETAFLAAADGDGGARVLAYTDTQDRARLTPLDDKLAPAAATSVEGTLAGARILGGVGERVVVAVLPTADGRVARAELRVLSCR